jgi:hypothetical protein
LEFPQNISLTAMDKTQEEQDNLANKYTSDGEQVMNIVPK